MSIPANAKVMLVEDDASMQSVLQTLLELEGFSVIQAPVSGTSAEIHQRIRDAQPDVLLLDVHLRGLSGLEVLEQVRSDPTTAPIRVVMTSGMDRKHECLAGGADDFLMKPYMPDTLIQKLRG